MPLTKTWVVTSDHPRETHSALAGETVPYDEPFSNGLQYPHDPNGPADETAGCTCILSLGGEAPDYSSLLEDGANWVSGLTQDEKDSYAWYDRGGFLGLNDALRAQSSLSPYSSRIADLDTALAKSRVSQDVVMYRGLDAGIELPESFTDRGYVSMTADAQLAREFGEQVIELRIPAGSVGAYVDSFGLETWRELMLPRGAVFRQIGKGVYVLVG